MPLCPLRAPSVSPCSAQRWGCVRAHRFVFLKGPLHPLRGAASQWAGRSPDSLESTQGIRASRLSAPHPGLPTSLPTLATRPCPVPAQKPNRGDSLLPPSSCLETHPSRICAVLLRCPRTSLGDHPHPNMRPDPPPKRKIHSVSSQWQVSYRAILFAGHSLHRAPGLLDGAGWPRQLVF